MSFWLVKYLPLYPRIRRK